MRGRPIRFLAESADAPSEPNPRIFNKHYLPAMSKILNEVLSANREYAKTFGERQLSPFPCEALRNPHMHGRST